LPSNNHTRKGTIKISIGDKNIRIEARFFAFLSGIFDLLD
jgi:hypothetical protein